MSNTATNQCWPKSTKNLNSCTPSEKIKIIAKKSPICEAIYIPEFNEVVVLTATEYVRLADAAELFNKPIREVVSANKSSNARQITNSREQLAEFIKKEVEKAQKSTTVKQTSVKPLTTNDGHIFIEIIELSSKKSSYIPRVIVESFRTKDKSYVLKPIASGSSATIASTAENPLKTTDGYMDRDNLKERFKKIKFEINAKWDLESDDPPLSGQLPSKYLARLLGGPAGDLALQSERFNGWLNTFDTWIGELNKNLNWVYNDKAIRKNKLLELTDPTVTAAEHMSPMLTDQSILIQMQKEVSHIWLKSKIDVDRVNVKQVNKLKWTDFAEGLSGLEYSCNKWAERISKWPTVMQFKKDIHSYEKDIHYPNDKDYNRRASLVSKLRAKANKAKNEKNKISQANSKRGKEKIVFDEDSLGQIKNEVEHIWGQSSKSEDLDFVKDIKSKRWSTFAKNDQTLIDNRKLYTQKIKDQDLPEYIFDASAEAQFMRYSFGATGSAIFNPLEGKIKLAGEAKADIALAEGKVNAKLLLPNSKGAEMSLPSINKIDKLKWVPVDSGIPNADTFDFDKIFLLPEIIETLGEVTRKWDVYKTTFSKNKVQIIGHTDASGNEKYNDILSKKRAEVAFEYLTYNYNAWFSRFERREWADREIMIMLTCVMEIKNQGGKLHDDYWKKVVNVFQNNATIKYIDMPVFQDVKEGCEVKNIPDTNPMKGTIIRSKDYGRIGITTPVEKETLKHLIQAYMQKGTGNRFLLESSFLTPKFCGEGESDLAIKTPDGQKEAKNRRVEIHLAESKVIGSDETVKEIPLGHIRIQIEAYLHGYAGANVIIAAELGFGGSQGQMQAKGLREGDAKDIGKEEEPPQSSTAKSHTLLKGKNTKYSVDDGLTTQAGAFLGAQATIGLKGILEWKCPKPEPTFYQPNVISTVPTQECKVDIKQAPKIRELAGFKDGFAELGSAGYALTGSAGIGLEGEIQVGFDRKHGKFLVKFKVKAVLGLGAGGAYEFSISARNVYWFIRFVHAQLNDHNFNYVNFMDGEAFDMFSAWTWELLKDEKWVQGGIVALGYASMKVLSEFDKILTAWQKDFEKSDNAEALAKQIIDENFLFSYMSPQVKGRVLYTLSHTGWINDEETKEQAILKTLSTIASKNEYKEILEHMGAPLPIENDRDREIAETMKTKTKREQVKINRVGNIDGNGDEIGTSEKRLLSILDDGWIFGGKEETAFKEWKNKLPDVAPKMTEA